MSNSRFTDVINAARSRPEQPQEDLPQQTVQQQPTQQSSIAPSTPQPQRPAPAKRGRPAGGKRHNPDYEQVGAYVPKELNKRVKMRLLEMDKDREFSELIEFLLKSWLQGNVKNG